MVFVAAGVFEDGVADECAFDVVVAGVDELVSVFCEFRYDLDPCFDVFSFFLGLIQRRPFEVENRVIAFFAALLDYGV